MKYKFLILLFLMIINFSSCNSSNSEYAFKYAIKGNPETIDPQRAMNDSSYAVISSVFQGLFTFSDGGEIINGMIDSYDISEDGTVWTFNLKSGIYWSDGDDFSAECSADDYVFAFQRLFRPETKSEHAFEYYIIKNSEKINKNIISDMSLLGVKALDKYKLEIILEKPYSDFKALLSLPPAMPCNKEFFESTQGRYGLAADCVASNGGYHVHSWNYDKWSDEGNYIILRRNRLNSYSESSPYTINLFIDPIDERKDFDEKVLKVYKSNNYEETAELKKAYNYSEYKTTVWGLIFNLNGEFSYRNYRLELSDISDLVIDDDRYEIFNGIIPCSVKKGDLNYRDNAGELADAVFTGSNVGSLSGMKMIMPDGTGLRAGIGKILQEWQSESDFYCSLSELDYEQYTCSLKNGDFDIALVKISGEYNSPYAYLNDFLSGNSHNYSSYDNEKYAHIINSALASTSDEQAVAYYKEAEQLLIDSGIFVPLCTEIEYVFYRDNLQGIYYNPFAGVYCLKRECIINE